MPANPNIRACTHIMMNGTRCGSPALRNEVFCYFHQRMIRGVRTPSRSRIHPMALLEDKDSIQASIMEVINALVRNQIDIERARLILRAVYIASKNARYLAITNRTLQPITEVPEYPEVPPSGPFALVFTQAEALAHINDPREYVYDLEGFDRALAEKLSALEPKPPVTPKKASRPRSNSLKTKAENGSRLYQ